MQKPEQLRELIDREIDKMGFADRLPGELYLPVDYVMTNGGKRLRPVLSLMACEVFSDNLTPALKPAAAIEIFHNFTLLHDDIMDKADIRRGKSTVHKRWNDNVAILSGDAMAVLSFALISSAQREVLPALLEVFNTTALEVCEGQQMDMNFESMAFVSRDMYLEMIRLKTSVLVAASMKIGALCGGASESDAALMYESGLNLGLGFQIQDDLLDLYGEQEAFGKKKGGDIVQNKKTFLLVSALEKAGGKTAERLGYLMEKEKDPQVKVMEIKKIFDELGIRKAAEEKARSYFSQAIEKLNDTGPGHSRKTEIVGFIKKVMERKT